MRKLILTPAILFTSCTPYKAPTFHEYKKTWKTQSTFNQTWEATIELFADKSWPISVIEKDSGIIVSDWLRINNQLGYADCGQAGGLAPEGYQEVRFNVLVANLVDNKPSLTINCNFREYRRYYRNSFYADCTSTGVLEEEIHNKIFDLLR